jgi:DNA-binding NarL/FixJ family response regulator
MGKKSEQQRGKITLHITERAAMSCALLKEVLSSPRFQIRVVSSAVDSRGTLEAVTGRSPDVALISTVLQEGDRSGLEILRQLRSLHPRTKCILLLDAPDRSLVVEAFRSGARGVYFRTDSPDMLPKAIRSVHQGQVWAGSRELQYLLEEVGQNLPAASVEFQPGVRLTDRELQVVRLVAEGYTNREISKTLGLSEHTVKNYVFRIFDKVGVSTRVELAIYVQNLLQPVSPASEEPGKLAG